MQIHRRSQPWSSLCRILPLLLVGMIATGCAPAASPGNGADAPGATTQIKRGGTLRIGTAGQPTSLDPQIGTGGGDHKYLFTMFDNLVAYNNDSKPDPKLSLAESWSFKNDTTIEFKIRKGVKFHDGTDINAEVIKWNMERVLDPKVLAAGRGALLVVDKMEIIDPYTIVFTLKEPSAPLLLNLGDRSGFINSPTAVKKWGDADYGRHPVGSGPFTFVEWIQDSHVKVKKNPDYWRKDDRDDPLPYLDEVAVLTLSDEAVLVASLRAGEIDVLEGLPGKNVPQFKGNPDFTFLQTKSSSVPDIRLNMDVFPFNNAGLRRAMSLALDREALVKANYGELGEMVRGPVTPGHAWAHCQECIQPTKRDLAKAREELQKAGYPNGFEWEYFIGSSTTASRLLSEMLQAQLLDVGIKTKITVRDTIVRDFYVERRFPAFAGSFSDRADPDGSVYEKYHSKGSYFATRDPANINPKVDELLDKARRTYDLAERKKLYNDAEKLIVDNVYGSIFLAYIGSGKALQKSVKGFELGGEGKGRYVGVWLAK
ncbi:MAG: ABC transporter substrate-binding protein [Chloroflexi bacterium]|nr:ABC transporter substrate-binding protein [Chloroflexota bacterium]